MRYATAVGVIAALLAVGCSNKPSEAPNTPSDTPTASQKSSAPADLNGPPQPPTVPNMAPGARTKEQQEQAKKAVFLAKEGRSLKDFLVAYPKAKLVSEKDGGVKEYTIPAIDAVYRFGFFGNEQLFHRLSTTLHKGEGEVAAISRVLERKLGKPDEDIISATETNEGVFFKRAWYFPEIGHNIICKGVTVRGKGILAVQEIVYTKQMNERQNRFGK